MHEICLGLFFVNIGDKIILQPGFMAFQQLMA